MPTYVSLLRAMATKYSAIIGPPMVNAPAQHPEKALHTSPAAIVGGLWYCWILAAVGLLSIFVPFADGVCRKDPWNWEYGCAQSAVAAKKALLEKEAEDISAQ